MHLVGDRAPRTSPRSSARRSSPAMSSARQLVQLVDLRRARAARELTSKYGFSVVAPISITRPSSTAGSSASCWALLKRWISSRKKIVRRPPRAALAGARDHLAHLGAARPRRRESSSKAASACSAAIRASVVLPVPGGP